MNAVPAERTANASSEASATIAIVLLGTGVVGGALLKLLDTAAAGSLQLVGAANSRRQQTDPVSLARRNLREQLNRHGAPRDNANLLAALDASGAAAKVIVDASASAALAACHPEWLA
ncbi:MAG: homoserine dehydrogenase, partial [Rhodanobacter sp.]